MLTINMRNDKLAAARADFTSRGMLRGTCLGEVLQALGHDLGPNVGDSDDEDEFSGPDGNREGGSDLDLEHEEGEDDRSPGPVDGPAIFSEVVLVQKRGTELSPSSTTSNVYSPPSPAWKYPCTSFHALGVHIGQTNLDNLVRHFLFCEQNPNFDGIPPLHLCPTTDNIKRISVFHSVTATFCAPSNPSGIGGLYCETIRCTPQWKTGTVVAPRRDSVTLNTNPEEPGMRGLDIA